MSEHGIIAYDLADYCCPECGRPVVQRLWELLTGCATCDAAITRHRCTARPSIGPLAVGDSWTCRECWSVWTVAEGEDTCGECGQSKTVKTWGYAAGARIDDAPGHQPHAFTPFRDVIPRATKCHRTAGGIMVHVKPDCRC